LVCGFIAFFVIAICLYYKHDQWKPMAFDSRQWVQANRERRGMMADDLVSRLQTNRMRVDAVTNLLGPPDG
jgi:phosphatidylglycerophosphatase A